MFTMSRVLSSKRDVYHVCRVCCQVNGMFTMSRVLSGKQYVYHAACVVR